MPSDNVRRIGASRPERKVVDDASSAAYRAALGAFARADYESCRGYLELCRRDSSETFARVSLLRARVARIDGDLETWYEAADVAAREGPSAADRITGSALRGLAAKRLGKTVEARQILAELETSRAESAPADFAYALYLLAADAWEDRDFDRAEALIRRNPLMPRDPESVALLGWIDVGRECQRLAGTRFMAALSHLRESGTVDVRLQARLVHAAAIVASETVDLRMGRRVRREYETLSWSGSLRVEQFNALTCLRYLALLEGDIERAWLLSREAIAVAAQPAYAAIAETNAAVASRLLGDEHAHRLQLRRAWDIIRAERWGQADAEKRVALTSFIIEAGNAMPEEVRQAVTMYASLRALVNRSNALEGDRRVIAFEALAAGRVHEVLGARRDAIRSYQRSLDLWSRLEYDMRAALVSLDLRRLTGDERYRLPVEAVLKRAPRAWFARDAGKLHEALDGIWPAQRAVFARLLEGKSAKAIGAELERSSFTVTNHTRKIFSALGVHSRDELRARCAELGITPAALREQPSLTSDRRRKLNPTPR